MEDIKNIENAKARADTFRKMQENKKRNKKYSPGFFEMAITFLTKPHPNSAKGRAAAKNKKAEPKGMSDRKSAPKKSVINGEKDRSKEKDTPKTWRDVKSVDAARKAGLNYFTGKDGKKKIAITAEQLKKTGMTLREYANSIKGKK